MDMLTVILTGALAILFYILFFKNRFLKRNPPGPMGFPVIGYLPFMSSKPYEDYAELKKRYGSVYSVQIGSQNLVAICDFKLIRKAFTDDAFIGRPPDLIFEISNETKRSGALRGLPYKEQRRFCLQMLRGLGFGKSRIEELIKDEIQEVIDRLTRLVQTPVKMTDILLPSVSNNIASVIFGKRMKYNDPLRVKLDALQQEFSRLMRIVGWQSLFPWIGAIARRFAIGNRGKLVKTTEKIAQYCRNELEEHESTMDPNNVRDFMDGYLLEMQKKGINDNTTFKKETLLDLTRQFFQAGSETVRVSIDWMLLLCVAYPELQRRIHAEIDETLGHDRFPNGQDRLKMPFTEAAIWEMVRWKSIVPINLLRYTIKDTELDGYFIPKHTKIAAIFWAIDHDETLWGKDVHSYRPERFLSEDGKKVVKPEHFIPFSIGKRSCPGKALAEIEIFLYLTAILQKFEFYLPPGTEVNLDETLGVVIQPIKQELYFKLRH